MRFMGIKRGILISRKKCKLVLSCRALHGVIHNYLSRKITCIDIDSLTMIPTRVGL